MEPTTGAVGRAYIRALESFMRECTLEEAELEDARRRFARRLIELAETGREDEWHLAREGLIFLRAVQRTVQERRANTVSPAATSRGRVE